MWPALGMPPVLACVACSVSTDSQEDFTAHGRQILFLSGCKCFECGILQFVRQVVLCQDSVWIQHQVWQSSGSVWTMLSELWWEPWCCPV